MVVVIKLVSINHRQGLVYLVSSAQMLIVCQILQKGFLYLKFVVTVDAYSKLKLLRSFIMKKINLVCKCHYLHLTLSTLHKNVMRITNSDRIP